MGKYFSCRFWLILGLLLLFIVPIVQGESNKLIELDFKNADVKDVLRALAEQSDNTFLIDDDVTGTVTIHLAKLTFTDAMNIIAKSKGLVYTKENKIFHISQIDNAFLKVEFAEGLLSVEARNAKISQLITEITNKTELKMMPAPEVKDRITISFNKIPLTDAVNTILTQANCMEEKIGKVSYIRPKSTPISGGVININYNNNLLTIDAQNAPIAALARQLSEKTGVSIVPEQNLSATISIFLQSLPLADALGMICDSNNLQLVKEDLAWRIAKKSGGAYRVKYKDNLLSIDADGVEVTELLNEISRQSSINIIPTREVRGPVTVHFQNLPLTQGLTSMLETQNWVLEKKQNYYNIRPNPNPSGQNNVRITYDPTSKLFDLDVQTAQITQVINELARQADVNVVMTAQVNWSVGNIRLKQQNFENTLRYILEGTVFTYKLDGSTYLIGDGLLVRAENADFSTIKIYDLKYLKADQVVNTLPQVFPRQSFMQMQDKNALIVFAPPEVQTKFADYLAQIDTESNDDHTEVIKVKYMKAEDVLKYIPPSIPKNDVVVVKEMNAITVTGPQNLINQVKQYIEKIDQVNPTIVFDVKVVMINNSNKVAWTPPSTFDLKNGTAFSFNYGNGVLGIVSTLDKDGKPNFSGLPSLDLLITNGLAKIVQNPTMTTLNGYATSFNVSTKRQYAVQETTTTNGVTSTTTSLKPVDSGLYITITPWVSDNKQITMEIKPKISQYGAPPSGQTIPETTEHSTEATIRVNDGDTVVISGLKTVRRSKGVSKFPLLGDIPLIGLLFRSTNYDDTQDEFVLLITPHLIYDEPSKDVANGKVQEHYSPDMQGEMKDTNSNPVSKPVTAKADNKKEDKNKENTKEETPADKNTPAVSPTPVPTPTPTSGA